MGSFDGNQSAKRGRELNDKFVEYAKQNPERFQALIDTAYAIGLGEIEGTVKDQLAAITFIFDRTCGKPRQIVDHGNADGQPFRHIAWPLPKTTLDQ